MHVVAIADDSPSGQASTAEMERGTTQRGRIKTAELAILTRQFATLLGSGLTVEESLSSLIQQSEGHQVKTVLSGVRSQVVEGHSLAEAVAQYPRSFNGIYHAAVAAGEQSGNLDEVLERLAEFIETRQGIQQRIGVALIYPVILTTVALSIVLGLLVYVVPKVVQVFEDTGQQLPFLTQTLISVSEFILDNGIWIIAAVIGFWVAGSIALKNAAIRTFVHQIFLKLPGVRRLSRGANTARMARTLAIMVGSGVPFLSAIRASEGVMSNVVLRQNLADAATEVAEGVSIHRALARSGNFPPLLVQMVASGEQSGRLDQMLEKAASALERELEARIAVLVGLFEPAMILMMGAIVLLIVLAVLLPIFDLNQLIS